MADWGPDEKYIWRQYLRHVRGVMREKCGLTERVRVWRVDYRDWYGTTRKRDRRTFVVKIAKRLDFSDAMWTLFHELGHVLSWGMEPESHGSAFGVAEAAMIREWEGWSAQ